MDLVISDIHADISALVTIMDLTTSVDFKKKYGEISRILNLGAILVKNDSSHQGIITDRDFAIKITVNKYPLDTPVHKVASHPLQKINANESILAAADIMASKKIRKLVVVEDGKVVGIITSTDLVNHISKMNNA